jgi:hypothetical protein
MRTKQRRETNKEKIDDNGDLLHHRDATTLEMGRKRTTLPRGVPRRIFWRMRALPHHLRMRCATRCPMLMIMMMKTHPQQGPAHILTQYAALLLDYPQSYYTPLCTQDFCKNLLPTVNSFYSFADICISTLSHGISISFLLGFLSLYLLHLALPFIYFPFSLPSWFLSTFACSPLFALQE